MANLNKSFQITKPQMHVLTSMRNGMEIGLIINYNELKLNLINSNGDNKVTHQLLLALLRRKLIIADQQNYLKLTILGERMANIGLKPENLGKSVFAKSPTQKDIKDSLNVSRNGYEIDIDAKKSAKASYKRNLNQSYK